MNPTTPLTEDTLNDLPPETPHQEAQRCTRNSPCRLLGWAICPTPTNHVRLRYLDGPCSTWSHESENSSLYTDVCNVMYQHTTGEGCPSYHLRSGEEPRRINLESMHEALLNIDKSRGLKCSSSSSCVRFTQAKEKKNVQVSVFCSQGKSNIKEGCFSKNVFSGLLLKECFSGLLFKECIFRAASQRMYFQGCFSKNIKM
ncbi:uncharacterized protein LOC111698346 [Eurytemora carolleeae]|uniref:uncharacterized protein LOC111698346 n=1 Tax=Eurytemora carolleeae TaxID=1294199 RepID=UPI000C788D6B|nr:uncharacterized protein LOC111698346 [Eurytemora carolleeae]|eukprot:XP_023324428.1 uncharacterized protein LOC111698346 [Eurytemora affinis]